MKVARLCIVLLLVAVIPAAADELGMQRENMRNILNVVAKDVEKNYYDPSLKGLDWKALTAQARQKIDSAKSVSEMVTAIYGLVDKLQDSHTRFLPPGRTARPIFGFEAMPFADEIRVTRLKRNGPAAAAGIALGDRILKVNRFDAEPGSYDLMMLYFHVIHPMPALEVTYQRGTDEPKTVRFDAKIRKEPRVMDLTNELNILTLISEFDREEIYFKKNFNDGIGYVQVPAFDGEERPEPHQLENPKAVLVDLRGNLGGALKTLMEFTGHFVSTQTTFGETVSRKKTEPMNAKPAKPNFGSVPVVVLVDSETSSAAELFARFMQIRGNAVVIGDRTSGRVVASSFFSGQIGTDRVVPFGTQISIAKVVFHDGTELEKKGVTPDVSCLPTGKDLAAGEDSCLLQAMAIAREKLGLGKALPENIQMQVRALSASMASTWDREYQKD